MSSARLAAQDLERSQRCIRTIVVDDSPLALRTTCSLVAREKNVQVVGTATNGRAAVTLARTLRPDLVLMNVGMSTMDGIEAISSLAQECPTARVVVVSLHDSPELRRACQRCGACAFLMKTTLPEDLPVVMRHLFGNGKCECI